MHRLAVLAFLLFSSPVWCQYVKDRYIVELADPPAADAAAAPAGSVSRAAASTTPRARRQAALLRRESVRARQQGVRTRVAANGAEVLGSIDLVGNALFVRTDSAGAARLAAMDGVAKVRRVRAFKPLLDRAVLVHHVDQVWARVGQDAAGKGVKIAIIDSGVDNGHPGLQDSSLPMPDGFPRTGRATDTSFTNSKVIVARSYTTLLSSRDPDNSPRDRVGHGTALAMIAAGATNTGPEGSITGVAPKAYIGNYKIFGTPGVNDSATDDAILQAIEDAVADGMDILSMSFGSNINSRLEEDPDVQAVERAAALGVITVAAAGNEGPDFNTLSSPATSPSAISVGASRNDRVFSPSAIVSGVATFITVNSEIPGTSPVTGPLVDVTTVDPTGLACSTLPAGSLSDKIVLILRGTCTFEIKLNTVARAGAIGALVYTYESDPEAFIMGLDVAGVPAQMLSYSDGLTVKNALASNGELQATLDFETHPVLVDANRMSSFSSAGPSVDLGVKPEVVAVGTDFYTATQSFDTRGDMYARSGYIVVDGTSFSTPFVAGVAALLKSTKPGLTVDQYRSLIINSANPLPSFRAQISGVGMVDAAAADRQTIASSPAVIGLGAGNGNPSASREVTIQNLTEIDDTYSVSVESKAGGDTAPTVDASSVQLTGAGSTARLNVNFSREGLSSGTYEGFIVLQGAASGTVLRIPYWYAVKGGPARITPLWIDDSPSANALDREAILFRVTDASGVALMDSAPEVTVVSGNATVDAVRSVDSELPGVFSLDLRFGLRPATAVVRIKAGNVVSEISIP
jgi:minor extracellular serine protease Vpr